MKPEFEANIVSEMWTPDVAAVICGLCGKGDIDKSLCFGCATNNPWCG